MSLFILDNWWWWCWINQRAKPTHRCQCRVVHGIGDGCDIGGLGSNGGGEAHLGGPLTIASGGGEEKSGEGEQTIVLLCLAFNRFHLWCWMRKFQKNHLKQNHHAQGGSRRCLIMSWLCDDLIVMIFRWWHSLFRSHHTHSTWSSLSGEGMPPFVQRKVEGKSLRKFKII